VGNGQLKKRGNGRFKIKNQKPAIEN